jgi:mechanosensitive ion channel-like protein
MDRQPHQSMARTTREGATDAFANGPGNPNPCSHTGGAGQVQLPNRPVGRSGWRRWRGRGICCHILSNIIAGLSLVFTRPYRVGEYIEMLGVHGKVATVELFTTPGTARSMPPGYSKSQNRWQILHIQLKVGWPTAPMWTMCLLLPKRFVAANRRVFKGTRNERACRLVGYTFYPTTG